MYILGYGVHINAYVGEINVEKMLCFRRNRFAKMCILGKYACKHIHSEDFLKSLQIDVEM